MCIVVGACVREREKREREKRKRKREAPFPVSVVRSWVRVPPVQFVPMSSQHCELLLAETPSPPHPPAPRCPPHPTVAGGHCITITALDHPPASDPSLSSRRTAKKSQRTLRMGRRRRGTSTSSARARGRGGSSGGFACRSRTLVGTRVRAGTARGWSI